MHIISGEKKGRKIITPNTSFRPTQSKVREAVFNILDTEGKTFLDLCAGSGSIGFEALSRKAKSATFIEIERDSVKKLFENAKNIFENKNIYEIKRISASDYTKKTKDNFDIIYFDPPYDSHIYEEVILNIINRKILNDFGVMIAETSLDYYKNFLFLKDLNYEMKKYGETVLLFFYKDK